MVSPRRLPLYVERLFDPVYRPPFRTGNANLFIVAVDADHESLQAVVDACLNEPTSGRVSYEVTENFVLLMFADLQDMGSVDPRDSRRGTVEEHELSIWLPMRHAATKLPAWYLPYVFNSEPAAVTTGREVFGYPKIFTPFANYVLGDAWPARIEVELPFLTGAQDRFTVRTLATLNVVEPVDGTTTPVAYQSGVNYTVELERVINMSVQQLKLRTKGNVEPPVSTRPRYRLRLGQADDPIPAAPSAVPAGMSDRADRQLPPLSKAGGVGRVLRSLARPGAQEKAYGLLKYAPLIFLKQFRDAEYPDRACYQAVIQSRLVLEGRPLQSVDAVSDPERRFQLGMPNTPEFPIVSELGLTPTAVADDGLRHLVPIRSLVRVSTSFSIDLGRVIWNRG
jgi:hypothetical protein